MSVCVCVYLVLELSFKISAYSIQHGSKENNRPELCIFIMRVIDNWSTSRQFDICHQRHWTRKWVIYVMQTRTHIGNMNQTTYKKCTRLWRRFSFLWVLSKISLKFTRTKNRNTHTGHFPCQLSDWSSIFFLHVFGYTTSYRGKWKLSAFFLTH